jgi:hypothetical protein
VYTPIGALAVGRLRRGPDLRTGAGYTSECYPAPRGITWDDYETSYTEDFADMFLSWVDQDYMDWNAPHSAGYTRITWMNQFMYQEGIW